MSTAPAAAPPAPEASFPEDSTGTLDRGNSDDGILVTAGGVIIGGAAAGEGNLVSGNNGDGIELNGANSTNATVKGNTIGSDVSGAFSLANSANGVLITTSSPRKAISSVVEQRTKAT